MYRTFREAEEVRAVLKGAVMYHDPKEVNANAIKVEEMRLATGREKWRKK